MSLLGVVRALLRKRPRQAAQRATPQDFMRTAGAPVAPQPERENPLAAYFASHTEGHGIWKWQHYFDVYHRHLAKFIGCDAHVVEIGVYSGGSLDMWRQYFGPRCRITGVDIQEACRAYAGEGISIVIGDQGNRSFWSDFRRTTPPPDVVIDDGGHTPEQQRVTLEETLPYLRPGGVYICEDIHGAGNEFSAYVHALADGLNEFNPAPRRPADGGAAVTAGVLQQAIRSIHFYPFVIAIEKADERVDGFVAPKHGTHWEPFLSGEP
jgi:23S rRNA U2552 (ribose-2'-O)-methylase RlmE/FtsJ